MTELPKTKPAKFEIDPRELTRAQEAMPIAINVLLGTNKSSDEARNLARMFIASYADVLRDTLELIQQE